MINSKVKVSKSTLSLGTKNEQKRLLKAIGTEAITHIRKRTENGKDINNADFEPYSDSTIYRKNKKGTKSSKVNLKDSGVMLRSLNQKQIVNGVEVFLSNRNRVGTYHQNGTDSLPQRQWFGLNKLTKRNIINKVFNNLKAKFNNK